MRDLIRCNLAGTIDGNERLVYYAIRRYFSCRPVTIRRHKNGERLALHAEKTDVCTGAICFRSFFANIERCNEQNKSFVYKRCFATSKFKILFFCSFSDYFFFVRDLALNDIAKEDSDKIEIK